MQYCSHCRVNIRGNMKRCVLCGNILPPDENGPDLEYGAIFPEIPPEYERHLAMRIMVFVSIVAIVASFAVRMIFPSDVNWPLFVLFGLCSMWLSLVLIIRKRHNIPKTIVWQVTIVSVLSVLWDGLIGWRGWSVNYVIPIVFVVAILVMYITGKITKLRLSNYVFYALLSGLFGIIPTLFIVFGLADVLYPSIICVSASVIFLAALFIFLGGNIRRDLKKRMHL
jgi:hypothetical protein